MLSLAYLHNFHKKILTIISGKYILWFAAIWIAVCGLLFSQIIQAFQHETAGQMPIDTLFPLTPEAINLSLQDYSNNSYIIYGYFLVVDFLFPPALSLFFCAAWSGFLQRWKSTTSDALGQSLWLLFPLSSTLLDWLENVLFAAIVYVEKYDMNLIIVLVCVIRWLKLVAISSYLLATPWLILRLSRAYNRANIE